MNSNSYFNAFILVFLSGLFWSFGVVTVRYMVDAHEFVFQYLFYRGISIAIILLIYLFLKEGLVFYKNFFRIGIGMFFTLPIVSFAEKMPKYESCIWISEVIPEAIIKIKKLSFVN